MAASRFTQNHVVANDDDDDYNNNNNNNVEDDNNSKCEQKSTRLLSWEIT